MSIKTILKKLFVTNEIERYIDNMPIQWGSYGYDAWGLEKDSVKIGMALVRYLYKYYFRVQANGLENIPQKGSALIIGNHSGQLPLDGVMIGYAVATNPYGPRAPRAMAERFFPTVPYIGNLLNLLGTVIGDPVNCKKMLENEGVIVVFPEGIRGSGKPYKKRYTLQRFGNGFMHLAMACNTPIIPVGVVGCEETIPSAGNIKPLADLLAIPYVPIAFPGIIPTKVYLNFGRPMFFDGKAQSEKEVTKRVEEVKDAINALIQKGLAERKGWF